MRMSGVSAFVVMLGFGAATLAAQQDTSGSIYNSNPTPQQQRQEKPAGVGVSNARPEDTSAPLGDTGERMRDRFFLKTAAQSSRGVVRMSQLALAKSSNDDVKTFAQKIMTDHAALARTWKPLAQELGGPPARELSKKDQKTYDRLSGLSGEQFDKEYMRAMAESHREDLKLFRDTMVATSNNSLKDALDRTIPVIQDHIMQADSVAHKNGYLAMQ